MSDKSTVHIWGRTKQHFSLKLRLAWCLKLVSYFWKFPFNVSGLYLTMESKTSDFFDCLLFNIENNHHLTDAWHFMSVSNLLPVSYLCRIIYKLSFK